MRRPSSLLNRHPMLPPFLHLNSSNPPPSFPFLTSATQIRHSDRVYRLLVSPHFLRHCRTEPNLIDHSPRDSVSSSEMLNSLHNDIMSNSAGAYRDNAHYDPEGNVRSTSLSPIQPNPTPNSHPLFDGPKAPFHPLDFPSHVVHVVPYDPWLSISTPEPFPFVLQLVLTRVLLAVDLPRPRTPPSLPAHVHIGSVPAWAEHVPPLARSAKRKEVEPRVGSGRSDGWKVNQDPAEPTHEARQPKKVESSGWG